MALISNATITTYAGASAKMAGIRVQIGAPSATDMAQFGGRVRHAMLLDPFYDGVPTDLADGDQVEITARDGFAAPPKGRFSIEQVAQIGTLNPQYRCLIAERLQR